MFKKTFHLILTAFTVLAVQFLVVKLTLAQEKMDLETHSALIEKLKSVVDLAEESVSKQNMILRLADLYSERARLFAMQDQGKGDIINKKQIELDRKEAVSLYSRGFQSTSGEQRGKVLLQMAQLNNLLGNSEKSKSLFDQVITDQKNYGPKLTSQAYVELGDYEYYKQNFKKAQKNFENALSFKSPVRQSYSEYRIAWCLYNLGDTEVAIQKLVTLLQNPEKFKKVDGSVDTSFKEEASRDLATFFARRPVSDKDIQNLIQLSPQNARESNLTYLATELDRTGKKESALLVWSVIGNNKKSGEEKIENQIRITKIQYDLGKKDQTAKEIKKAAQMLKEDDCGEEDQCELLRQQLKKIVTDWGAAEERSPSVQLVNAYKSYLDEISDLEMSYWAGIAAQKTKQYAEAFEFYKVSAGLSVDAKKSSTKNKSNVDIDKVFEGSLLGAIDVAEQSKNLNLRDRAYEQYLKLNPSGEKALEVQYQVAQVLLEKKKYEESASLFKQIALSDKPGSQSIKDKAADLALDTLVLLKDDERIEEWANEFASKFQNRKNEFLTISRKSAVNQAAYIINTSKSNSELQKQFDKLSKMDLAKASTEERMNIYRNRSLISIKLKNLDAILLSSAALLKEKSISEKERQEALARTAWVFEMKLDFKNALATLKKMTPAKNQEDEHLLKLGVVSELAKQNPTSYYEKYIKVSGDNQKRQEVALSLVRVSPTKNSTFKKYKNILSANSKKYVTAALYAYNESPSESLFKDMLDQRSVHSTFEGQLLGRRQQIQNIQSNAQIISKHRLQSQNQTTLKRTMQERLNLLDQVERSTQKYISTKDFTLQFLSLSILATENNRLAKDVLKLPTPKGMNKKDREQYKKLVQDQVTPYLNKSKEITRKLAQLWDDKNDSAFAETFNLASRSDAPGYRIALEEVQTVSRTAKKMNIESSNISGQELAKKKQQRQKLSLELIDLKAKVQKNPFEFRYLQKMMNVESELGSGPMVAYLTSRLTELKTGGRE